MSKSATPKADDSEDAPNGGTGGKRTKGSGTPDRHDTRNARLLRWLIRATSLAALKDEASAIVKAARTRALLKAVEFIFWALVVGFAFGAFVTWLAAAVGPLWACAIVAGGAAVIAIVLHLIVAYMARNKPTIHLKSAFPAIAEVVGEHIPDGAALATLLLAILGGLFVSTRGRSR